MQCVFARQLKGPPKTVRKPVVSTGLPYGVNVSLGAARERDLAIPRDFAIENRAGPVGSSPRAMFS